MGQLVVIVSTRAVLVAIETLRIPVAAVVLSIPLLVVLGPVANPESCQEAGADSDEQSDEALRDRANTSEREPTGADRVLNVLHDVTDYVVNLRARERPGTEARHVTWAGADRFPDHCLGHAMQWRRLDSVRQARRRRL